MAIVPFTGRYTGLAFNGILKASRLLFDTNLSLFKNEKSEVNYNASPTDKSKLWLFVRKSPLKLFVMPMV